MKGTRREFDTFLKKSEDDWILLDSLQALDTPDWMKTLATITMLRTVESPATETVEAGTILSAAQLINSPSDLNACYGKKRTILWVAYNADRASCGLIES